MNEKAAMSKQRSRTLPLINADFTDCRNLAGAKAQILGHGLRGHEWPLFHRRWGLQSS